MSFSTRLRSTLRVALGSPGLKNLAAVHKVADELMGVIGITGGFAVSSNSNVMAGSVAGDMTIQDSTTPGLGLAAGQYRMRFNPKLNPSIVSILDITTSGFTPRSPSAAETCETLVTGWGQDSQGWYVTIVIATLSNHTITATPPANFVVGIRASITLEPNLVYTGSSV